MSPWPNRALHVDEGSGIFSWGLLILAHGPSPVNARVVRPHMMPRIQMRMALALVIILGALASGCVSQDEVARSASPSGRVEAVLVERNGGATTSFGYEVFLVPSNQPARRGRQVASLYGAVRNESAYGVNLRWDDEHTLALEYLEAKQAELVRSDAIVNADSVRVVLRSGIGDPTAPAGGMLYNLRGRR
jgi:hypothetical protein